MLIDLTTFPPTLLLDECPTSLTVRTWAAFGVSGLISRRVPIEYGDDFDRGIVKERLEGLKPAAQVTQGRITCYETRIPLTYKVLGTTLNGNALLLDPWEVATGAKDVLTGRSLTWRATLQVAPHQKNQSLLIISIGRYGDATALAHVATKSLSDDLFKREPLPLQRLAREAAGVLNTWERLVEDD